MGLDDPVPLPYTRPMKELNTGPRGGQFPSWVCIFAGWVVAIAASLGTAPANARPAVQILLPDSADTDLHLLEKRLAQATQDSGIPLTRSLPGVEWHETLPSDMLQTNLIMGIQDFYNSDFESAERKLGISLREMRDNPKTLRSGLVSLLQIQEGAISLARALKHRQNTKESENWLRWLIFTLPNAQIGLDKYPPAIVEIADRTRESFETQTGTLEWRTGNPLEDCKLWLNGTRSFKEKEIRLPVGTYRAEVTCQNSTGWTRSIAIAPDERTSLSVAPDAESQLRLLEDGVQFIEWPPRRETLRSLSALLGRDLVFANRAGASGETPDVLAYQRLSPTDELETLAWTEYPNGTVEPESALLLQGSLPERSGSAEQGRTIPMAWAWSAYGVGAALLVAGALTNGLAEQGTSSSIDRINEQRDQRTLSIALYGAGGASMLSGILLHALGTSPAGAPRTETGNGK